MSNEPSEYNFSCMNGCGSVGGGRSNDETSFSIAQRHLPTSVFSFYAYNTRKYENAFGNSPNLFFLSFPYTIGSDYGEIKILRRYILNLLSLTQYQLIISCMLDVITRFPQFNVSTYAQIFQFDAVQLQIEFFDSTAWY